MKKALPMLFNAIIDYMIPRLAVSQSYKRSPSCHRQNLYQRRLATAVKRARQIALLPYVTDLMK